MARSATSHALRERIADIPVIDCHEHSSTPMNEPYRDAIAALTSGYVHSDLHSLADDEALVNSLGDHDRPLEERWPAFERLWKGIQHTGYARVTRWVLQNIYEENELSLDALKRVQEKLLDLSNPETYWGMIDDMGVKCRLLNVWIDWEKFLSGELKINERERVFISLPEYHGVRSYGHVHEHAGKLAGTRIVTLDEYLDACRTVFAKMKERGAIGFKDQSAYGRVLDYGNATRSEAEALFNYMMEDPRRSLGWPEAKPLDDFLFHQFMVIARDLDLPVQLHTGHMAGIRNDVAKTNAANLRNVLELHRDVTFDLFHGNWPYMGDWLYLGKNYPNVCLDCCWLHIIDPVYSRDVLYQGLTAVPHGKINGFGGDYGASVEYVAGHLEIARDNIAFALGRHVDEGWLDTDEAAQVAADWLFNNPNRIFRLGFEDVEG